MQLPPADKTSNRLAVVDGLRAIAAPMVAWLHIHETSQGLQETLPLDVNALFMTFGVGVQIFFVVSGFAIAQALDGITPSLNTFARFVARRVVRLDPPYWLSIAIAIAVVRVSDIALHRPPSALPGGTQVLVHATYTVPFFGYALIQDIYWTLMVEFQFYLVLFLLTWMGHGLRRFHPHLNWLPLGLMTLWGLLTRFWAMPAPHPGMWLWPHWHVFVLGILCSFIHRRILPAWTLLVACAVTLLCSRLELTLADIVGMAAGLFLFVSLRLNAQDRWLSQPAVQWMGKISYSVYLLHPVFGQRFANLGYRVLGHGPWAAWVMAFLSMGVSILAAWAMCISVERPAMALARRIPRKPMQNG